DGGPGAYSQLLILNEYMNRVAANMNKDIGNIYPADYFDIISGIGFGGLISVMLGHFKMSVNEAIDSLVSIATDVFPIEACLLTSRWSMNAFPVQPVKCASCIPPSVPSLPPTSVLYAATQANLSHLTAFRTYKSQGCDPNPAIVDAICGTMAMPSFFSPTNIGKHPAEQTFVGGGVILANPTRELLKEATYLYEKSTHMYQILNIGSGMRRVASLDVSESTLDIIRSSELENEAIASDISTRVDRYLRLDVNRGMEDVNMDQWNKLGLIHSHTDAYLGTADVRTKVESFLGRLHETNHDVIVENIGT
ncbi:hypothetical protein M408DRAFT_79080, partial [Serendipita vermifera MAFF 305830]